MGEHEEIAFRRVSPDRIEVSREGGAEARYVAVRRYQAWRYEDPGRNRYGRVGDYEYPGFDEAAAACREDARALGEDILPFAEEKEGVWNAPAGGSGRSWEVDRMCFEVIDPASGENVFNAIDEDDLRSFVEREARSGRL